MEMKKISMLLLAASMTAISFTSCDKDIITGDTIIICPYQYPTYIVPGSTVDKDGNYAITFSGYSKSSTRAAATTVSGTGYDDLALWCWNSDETVMDKFHVQYTTGWTYAGVDNQDIKYFKNQYDSHEFIGIIPHDAQTSFNSGVVTVSDVTAFSQDNPWESPSGALVGTNSADTPDEFLYCYENVAKSSYATGATLNFKHGNYKVYLKFTSDDANTEILDYCPATSGYHAYQMVAKPFLAIGPLLTALTITDEDIAYINSHYSSSLGWIGYYSQNSTSTIDGDLQTNMTTWLNGRYDNTLLASGQGQWATYLNNPDMRLVHIEKTGHTSADNDSYKGWFVNIQNVQLVDLGTSGTPAIEGIRMLPATSAAGDGSDAVLASYPLTADATVSSTGLSFSEPKTTSSLVQWTIPAGKVSSTPVASPTVFYGLPIATANVGYTVKVSYEYKGTKYYDSRVWIPASECQFQAGKYYTFVINITGANGNTTPDDSEKDDPTVTATNEIRLISVSITDYENGGTQTHTIN